MILSVLLLSLAHADLKFTPGNHVEFLRRGTEFYPVRLEMIRGARSAIDLTTFQYCDGIASENVTRELIAAADRGVRVRLLIDGFNVLPHSKIYAMLKGSKVEFARYNPPPRDVNNRLHMKAMIVDDEAALVGGANLCDEYLIDRPGEPVWHDFESRVTGPVVSQVQAAFDHVWSGGTAEPRDDQSTFAKSGDAHAAFLLQDPKLDRDSTSEAAKAFVGLIDQAKKRLLVYKPYVHLDERVLEAIKRAARRGVEVRIFTNSWESNRLPDTQHIIVAYSYYPELYAAGVHIHEEPYRTEHGKALLVDDRWLALGSHDMTPRAMSTNIEDMLFTDDAEAIAKFASFTEQDMRELPEVTAADFASRDDSLWDRFRLRLGHWARPLF